MNYFLIKLSGKCASPPLTSVVPGDLELIEALKAAGFGTIEPWIPDYLYFTYR